MPRPCPPTSSLPLARAILGAGVALAVLLPPAAPVVAAPSPAPPAAPSGAGGAGAQPRAGGLQAPGPLVIQHVDWRPFGLVLRASSALDPDVFALDGPPRFVVDLPAGEFADPSLGRTIPVGRDGIKQVRLSERAGGGIRLVFDLEAAQAFQVMQLAERTTLVIARAGQHDAALAALVRAPNALATATPGQKVRGLTVQEAANQVTLRLDGQPGGKPLRYSLFQEAPGRLRLRVPGAPAGLAAPPTGTLLRRADVKTGPEGWTLDLALAEGHWELAEARTADGGATLTWERMDPRARGGRPLVVIDPGHGGADPGAIGPNGKLEKDVCLALGRTLRDALRRRGLNAILTRGADAEVYLAPRLALVERWRADLFVSLHANSHTGPDATGVETYWREGPSQGFAEAVHRTVATLLHRPDRGTKQERLYVLRHPRVPSLLFEAGFISNPGEERLLDDPDFQDRAAFALATGIESYMMAPPTAIGARSDFAAPLSP